MLQKLAYIVIGPESSGNRYMTRLLCAAGCVGKGEIKQPFDDNVSEIKVNEEIEKIAFYRSYPHGTKWIDLVSITDYLKGINYYITVFVMFRDQSIMELSQVKVGHVKTKDEAKLNICKAYCLIFEQVVKAKVKFIPVIYHNLGRKKYIKWLFGEIGLFPENIEKFENADLKYEPIKLF